jgi:hypothetical protein
LIKEVSIKETERTGQFAKTERKQLKNNKIGEKSRRKGGKKNQ